MMLVQALSSPTLAIRFAALPCGFLIKSERMFVSSKYRVKTHPPAGGRIGDFRKVLVERLHRLQQANEAASADWLDHQLLALAMHDRLVAGKLKFHRDADRLVAAIAKKPDAALFGQLNLQAYAKDICLKRAPCKGYFTFGVTSSPKICIWSKSSCTELAAK